MNVFFCQERDDSNCKKCGGRMENLKKEKGEKKKANYTLFQRKQSSVAIFFLLAVEKSAGNLVHSEMLLTCRFAVRARTDLAL
jgi:predicted secreted acid phosphatase